MAAEGQESAPVRGRLAPLFRQALNAEQEAMWLALAESPRGARALRPEGYLTGPFDALLRSPALGMAAARLGTVLRFESGLEARWRELTILTVAARWGARWAWFRHADIARRAGVSEAVMEAIAAGRPPTFEHEGDRTVHAFVSELVGSGFVGDDAYARALALLGEAALVDLVALAGYYSMESFVLNAFAVPLPEGERVSWDPA